MTQYIIECIAFQLVFLVIYDVFLKRETFFQWNRAYLIVTYVLSLVLPWIKIEALKTAVPETFQEYPEFLWGLNDAAITVVKSEESNFNIPWEYAILFNGMLLAALFLGYKLYQIYALKQKGKVHYFQDFTQVIITDSRMAFSFFKFIFLGDKVLEKEYQSIVKHELVHIRQKHSYDLLFFELMRIMGWFNPLVYVYQNRVSELHEFIADAQVAKTDKKQQYELLLSEIFQTQNISFINQFFKTSLIKKRIVMLQKTKSKKIWQLKYLLLLPMIIGMLAYTSAEQEPNSSENIQETQTIDDAELIAKIKAEIEQEIAKEGSFEKVFFGFTYRKNKQDDTQILNKEEYFKERILFEMMFKNMKPVEFGDDVKSRKRHKMHLPSTASYKSYVSRKMAFEILDTNLQYSIKAYEQHISLIDVQTNYPKEFYVFEVVNAKDLTGIELRAFNNKLAEIFERGETSYTNIVLTDNEFAFKVYTGIAGVDISIIEKSNKGGYVKRTNNPIKLNVFDRKHMTKGEKEQEKELMDEVLNSQGIDTLIVSDRNTSSTFSSNSNKEIHLKMGQLKSIHISFAKVDEVPIFPGCENDTDPRACFNRMIQKHISKNFRYPEEAQKLEIQGRVSVLFVINKEGQIANVKMRGPDLLLEEEAKRIISRLPKMKAGIHEGEIVGVTYSIPITFKLNMSDKETYLYKYGELLKERHRLLKSTNGENPIIVNLNDQLNALKTKLQQNNASQKELEEQYLKLLKEREEQKINKSQLETEGVPFAKVDEIPVFPGCEDASDKRACFNEKMQLHIGKNFNYPIEAKKKGVQGRVSLMFIISKSGKIKKIRMRGPHKLLEDEADRIIKKLPKMKPGKHKGKKVNVPFSIPIVFKL